jgi:hypothetical protein
VGGRIVDLLSTPHLATEALLPWLLNGTLTGGERRDVEAHLRSCTQCRGELAYQQRLMSHYLACAAADDAPDAEQALQRLQQRIASDPPRRASRRPAVAAVPWRWLLAVQLGAIVALGSLALLQLAPIRDDDAVAPYRGLADPAQRASGDALVVFAPTASEAAVRAALQRAGARIVDGPTAAGAYVLQFDAPPDAALAALRAEGTIVRVELLGARR